MDWIDTVDMCIVALYLAGAVLYLGGMLGQRLALKKVAAVCALGGFALHGVHLVSHVALLGLPGLTQGGFHLGLLAWLLLLIFFILWWRLRLEFLALTASPLALLLFLSSLTTKTMTVRMPEALSGLFFGLHIGSLFLALALLTMAFGAGIIFMHLEKKIKTKEKLTGFRKDLPSLQTFDRANHVAVVVGFPLYTIGLLSGFVFGRLTWGRLITWDPKEIVSELIWLVYAFLFHQRLTVGWRGRKAARLAILVFLFSVLSLVVVNFMVPSHHSFLK